MSKIICDVCGTSYQETATQCPICGCVRSGEPVTVSGDTNDVQVSPVITYTHIRGGRFSKANVKKRNAGVPVYSAESPAKPEKQEGDQPEKDPKKSEKALVAVVIVLLIAIAAVVVYIAADFMGLGTYDADDYVVATTTVPTTETTEATTAPTSTEMTIPDVPCAGIALTESVFEFATLGEFVYLEAVVTPENCTDEIVYRTEDDSVATVDDQGRVDAVGAGQTVIHVTCGEYEELCRVVCTFQEETTTPTVPEGTYTEADLKFADNGFGYEYTVNYSEGSYNPYRGDIPADLVSFTSSDESVATVDADGLVTFVGRGNVEIYANYNGWEIKCLFRIG